MKRVLILVLFTAFKSVNLFAQGGFDFGFKGGVNASSVIIDDPLLTYKNRTGIHLGAFSTIKVAKVGIQGEVLFSSQGGKLFDSSQEFIDKYNYINVPVLLKGYVAGGFSIYVGPQFGFLVDAAREFNGTSEDLSSFLLDSDVSMAMGFAFDIPGGVVLDARYNLGVSNINNSTTTMMKNQVFQFSIGYKFLELGK